jgi:hypothetical protein
MSEREPPSEHLLNEVLDVGRREYAELAEVRIDDPIFAELNEVELLALAESVARAATNELVLHEGSSRDPGKLVPRTTRSSFLADARVVRSEPEPLAARTALGDGAPPASRWSWSRRLAIGASIGAFASTAALHTDPSLHVARDRWWSNATGYRTSWSSAGDGPTALADGEWELAGGSAGFQQEDLIENGVRVGRWLRSIAPIVYDFGTVMMNTSAVEARGMRLRLSALVKSQDVADWAGLWLRVDGQADNPALAFNGMENRPIRGTTSWTRYEVVVDVPDAAQNLAFGVLIKGTGQVWFKDMSLESVASGPR